MPNIVSIVSGGPSASLVDLASVPGFVIGVNNAALHAPRIDAAITMDRRWSEAYWTWFKQKNEARWLDLYLRPNNVLNISERPDWLHVYHCNHRTHVMSDEPGTLNGTNSGGVALNLAYAMRPKRLYLFGFDYCSASGHHHWFAKGETGRVGDYPIHANRYRNWAREFDDVGRQFKARGIDVINVSTQSVVTAFRKIAPKDFNRRAA